jgi:HlyD family secretion protein
LALRPGMTCRAEIFTDSAEQALAVPVQAVMSNNAADTETVAGKSPPEEEHYIFVEVDGKAERRVVQVGLSDDSHQEIRSGLKAGENVVIGPYKILRHLKHGEALEVTSEEADKAESEAS